MPFKCMQLTDYVIKVPHSARQKFVRRAWERPKSIRSGHKAAGPRRSRQDRRGPKCLTLTATR
ncbi:hypothetical protein FQN60_003427 [Etheostoma spectabile]|uniref:Large ribosomal subunit protein eL14 domain-containing protein n=1 Tax=Etheostoma spectabile TaxID=54343 RepID=A0A5J5CAH2_9PERO|nr:hypothetical protein FQN60_003427 [Etheostoma spectabile]